MKRIIKQNLNYVVIILAFFILIIGGLACEKTPEQLEGITIAVQNQSSVAVKVVFWGPDDSSSSILPPGEIVRRQYIKSGGTYVVVVKPMGDWLSFAQARRDRLVESLAKAKESGNIDDIYSIAEQLRAVTSHISNILEASTSKSTGGAIEGGGNEHIYVRDGELVNSIILQKD